jgi:hypothetical protein
VRENLQSTVRRTLGSASSQVSRIKWNCFQNSSFHSLLLFLFLMIQGQISQRDKCPQRNDRQKNPVGCFISQIPARPRLREGKRVLEGPIECHTDDGIPPTSRQEWNVHGHVCPGATYSECDTDVSYLLLSFLDTHADTPIVIESGESLD